MKYNITIVFFLLTMWVHCQPPMHAIFNENHTYCIFNSALVVDSGYIIQGQVAKEEHSNQSESMLVFINTLGTSNFFFEYWDENNFQNAGFNRDRLILNEENNIEFGFRSRNTNINNISRFRKLEININGGIVNDNFFDTLTDYLEEKIFDSPGLLNRYNNNWLSLITKPINSPTGDFIPVATTLFKTDYNLNIINSIELKDVDELYSYIHRGTFFDTDTSLIVFIHARRQVGGVSPAGSGDISRTLLCRLDTSLNILDQKIIADPEYNLSNQQSCIKVGDEYVLSYWQGKWFPDENINSGEHLYLNTISSFDSDFNELWRIHSDSLYVNESTFNIANLIGLTDTSFISISGTILFTDTIIYPITQVRKLDRKGNIVWSRDHILFPNDDPVDFERNIIREVSVTQDGGFLAIGEYGKSGFVLKTNCLGFLGDPIADFTSTIQDNFTITFENQSIQAGGYVWDFGDGTTYRTAENETTVTHTYSGFGSYEVKLIAEGCNGIKDTIQYTVQPKKHGNSEAVVENDNGVFTIFPNPSIAGNSIYMYLSDNLNATDAKLVVTNAVGKEIYTQNFTAKEGTYVLPINLSAGNYNFTLYTSDKKQNKKVVVN